MKNRAGAATYRLAALLLLLIAWAALLFRLNDVPPGFQHDQMFNSLDALDALGGRQQIYFPANFGREPLGIYSAAGVFWLAGGHYVWSLRFSSVLWGMLGLAVTLPLARRYLPRWGALFVVALMAGSFWFLFAARLGLEPMASLPLAVAMLYFLCRGLERRSWADLAASGVMGGIALYTYLAPRVLLVLPPLLLAHELLLALLRRARVGGLILARETKANAAGLLLGFLLMLLVSSPLLLYLRTHPGAADARVNELKAPITAALRGDLRPVLGKVGETALSILWVGPPAIPYQYNVPGRAALQPVWAICFVVGLGGTVARWLRLLLRSSRKPAQGDASVEFLLLSALVLALGPVLLTGADALYMRGIIALPLLFIVTTRGLWAIGTAIGARRRPSPKAQHVSEGPLRRVGGSEGSDSARLRVALITIAFALLLWHLVESGHAYFVTWARAEPTQRIYNADFRAAAAYLAEHPEDRQVFIGTDRDLDLDRKTYQLYEPPQRDVHWFYLPGSPPLPSEGSALYLWPASLPQPPPILTLLAGNTPDEIAVPERLTDVGGRRSSPKVLFSGSEGGVLLRGLRLDQADVERALARTGAQPLVSPPTYGDTLLLDAAGARDAGTHAELATHWTALTPWPYAPPPGLPPTPPKLAVSVSDASGYHWAQADVAATMPFRTWQPDDALLEVVTVSLPADLPPGSYDVRLALYDDRAGTLAVQRDGARVGTAPVVARLLASERADRRRSSSEGGAAPQPPLPVETSLAGKEFHALGKWEPLETLLSGVPADLHVSWEAAPGAQGLDTSGLHFQLRATDASGNVLWEQPADPLTSLPQAWPAGQVYRLTHRLLPQTAKPGAVQAQVELCALRDKTALTCSVVGRPEVVNRAPLLALAEPPQYASGASWEGGPALAGYDVAEDGDAYSLTLYWRTEEPPATELKRFVHAVDDQGQIIAQADGTPDNGGIPMTAWRPGEYVVDTVRLKPPVGQDVAQFYVGWYAPETGARLPVRLPSGEALPDDRFGFAAH